MAGSRTLKLSILADVDDLNKKLKAANADVETNASGLEKFGKAATAAFVAAAAAAATYAVKLGVDGVKAAIEDEAAQSRLAQTLKAATGATDAQIKSTEAYITKMQLATGVSDNQLRAAMARLSLSTNDVAKSQELLSLALDISKARQIPLENVANALGKAYDGQTTALGRLGLGLSSAELKGLSFTQVQDRLNNLFSGAAADAANTYEGRIARLKEQFAEFQENIGYKLIPILSQLMDWFLNKIVPALGEVAKIFKPVTDAIERNKDSFLAFGKIIVDYVVPALAVSFGGALKVVASVAGWVIDVIGKVADGITTVVNGAISAINVLIRAYNAIPFLPNVSTIGSISAPKISVPSITTTPPKISTPTVPTIPTPSTGGSTGSGNGLGSNSSVMGSSGSNSQFGSSTPWAVAVSDFGKNYATGQVNTTTLEGIAKASGTNVTVNIGVVGDPESAARTITDLVQQSYARGTGGSLLSPLAL